MKCKICNKELEFYGSNYVISNNKKLKKVLGCCTRHIPNHPVTLVSVEKVK